MIWSLYQSYQDRLFRESSYNPCKKPAAIDKEGNTYLYDEEAFNIYLRCSENARKNKWLQTKDTKMEILIGIGVVLVLVFIFGGIANNKPVRDWPDDKLIRMHGKLLNASKLQTNSNKRLELFNKAEEVLNEINRRQGKPPQQKIFETTSPQSDIEKKADKDLDAKEMLDSVGLTDDIENSGGISSFIEEQAIIQNRIVEGLPNLFDVLFKISIDNGMKENEAKENAKYRLLDQVLPHFERAKMDGMTEDEAIDFVVKKLKDKF